MLRTSVTAAMLLTAGALPAEEGLRPDRPVAFGSQSDTEIPDHAVSGIGLAF